MHREIEVIKVSWLSQADSRKEEGMLEGQVDGNHDERGGLLTLHDLGRYQ